MTRTRRTAIVALLLVYVAVRVFWWYDGQQLTGLGRLVGALGLVKVGAWVIPVVLVVALTHRARLRDALAFLGLAGNRLAALRFGLYATLPMAFAVAFAGPARLDPVVIAGTVLIGPFAEEVLFRGFLLKTLLADARWSVGWAIAVSAAAFGAAHIPDLDLKTLGNLYQLTAHHDELARQRLLSMAFDLATMGAGGVVFGWVFYRLGSLWPAIALHGYLNLWRTLAEGDPRPETHVDAVAIAQTASFVLAILLTLRWRPVVSSPSPARP